MTTAAMTLAAAAAMVTVEARATVAAVTLSAASSSGNGGDGTTTDIRDAILPWYTDAVDVGRDNNGSRAPAIDGGNIDGGVAFLGQTLQALGGWLKILKIPPILLPACNRYVMQPLQRHLVCSQVVLSTTRAARRHVV
jgi:hypothetical protein